MPEDTSRESVEKIVRHYLGKVDDDVVSVVLRGISKGYDQTKLRDRLSEYIKNDKKMVAKITDKVWEHFDIRDSKKRFKEESDANGEEKEKKRRKFEESPAFKVKKEEVIDQPQTDNNNVANDNNGTDLPPEKTVKDIKDIMAEAQRMIEERKKQLNLKTPIGPAAPKSEMKLSQSQASQFLSDAMAKHDRATELRDRISSKLPALLSYQSFTKQEGKPTPLILNDQGRTIDSSGREVQLIHRIPTLKANLRSEKKDIFKKISELSQVKEEVPQEQDAGEGSSFYDPRVNAKAAVRKKRPLMFHEKGDFEKLGQRIRAKVKLEKLQQEISQAAKKTGISSAVKLAFITPKALEPTTDEGIPTVEWWDSVILPGETYDLDIDKLEFPAIQALVEHPAQMMPADYNPNSSSFLKVYLTKKERKKLRRQNRKEMQREQSEKVRLGLEPPPEPKVKISNLMRVLGTAAVQDPTKMEAHVREQMAKRLKKHEDANLARKLTPQQKKEKKAKKIKEDTSSGVNVVVYRITDLSHPAKKFKVEMNAKQLYMTGIVVLHKDVNVVVVEGGPKQQRFFKKLMMERIKWNEDSKDSADKVPNRCALVWEGTVKERAFGEIKFKLCPLEKMAREIFQKQRVEHYWDAAYSGAVLEQTEDETT